MNVNAYLPKSGNSDIEMEENNNENQGGSFRLKKQTSFYQTATLDALSSSERNLYENDRPALTEKDLREKYSFNKLKSNDALKGSVRYVAKRYKPSGGCLLNYFLDRVPFFRWIQTYDAKENILKDTIAGLTIGIVHIPQGMAYSLMAGLPAVYGLYVSLFPVLIYVFLGTSRHLSIGSFAITSLMTYSAIEKLEGKYYGSGSRISGSINSNNLNFSSTTGMPNAAVAQYLSDDPVEAKIKISMAVTLLAGLIQVWFGFICFLTTNYV